MPIFVIQDRHTFLISDAPADFDGGFWEWREVTAPDGVNPRKWFEQAWHCYAITWE